MVGLGGGGRPEAPAASGRGAWGLPGKALLWRGERGPLVPAELVRLACPRKFWARGRLGATLLLLSVIARPAALPVGLAPGSSSL